MLFLTTINSFAANKHFFYHYSQEELKKKLKLTAPQEEQLTEIFKRHNDETKEIQVQLRAAKRELKRLWVAEDLDKNEIKAKMDQVTDLKMKMHEACSSLSKDVKNILTKGQLEELERMQKSKQRVEDKRIKKK